MSSAEFVALPADSAYIQQLCDAEPGNSFRTPEYFASRERLGWESRVVGLKPSGDEGLFAACGAFLKRSKLDLFMEIQSLPAVNLDSPFWTGLRSHCNTIGVTSIDLGTFGSVAGVEIPPLSDRCSRSERCEFHLDLSGGLLKRMSSSHRRNVKKAEKRGLTVVRSKTEESARAHERLRGQSFERRKERGESVPDTGMITEHMSVLDSGSGEIFQAIGGEDVLSSVLVLHAPDGAYYQSAGTAPDGRNVGASHFLIHKMAVEFAQAGRASFNLGGAEQGTSLASFKQDFGAIPIELPAMSCDLSRSWRRAVKGLISMLRNRGAR